MPFFDLPQEELTRYQPKEDAPADFDLFWKHTLDEARQFPMQLQLEKLENGLKFVESYDLSFPGFAGQPVKAWLNLPKQRGAKLPTLVEYIGYGGGRGFATDWLLWPNFGYAHLVMDTRGQGSDWSPGHTPDFETEASNPQAPGFMTRGILSPKTYYYRRVFVDAVRAVDAALAHPDVDAQRLAVSGGSQGGGISIAAASLHPAVKVLMPDVPFLCNFRRAAEITDAFPYREISKYIQVHRNQMERVFNTLAYFDGMHHASRCHAQALYSVGLMDEVCPPSTVYAAYNRHAGPKQMRVYPFNRHEGGGPFQVQEKVKFLASLWPAN